MTLQEQYEKELQRLESKKELTANDRKKLDFIREKLGQSKEERKIDTSTKEKKLETEQKKTDKELALAYKESRDELKKQVADMEQKGELNKGEMLARDRLKGLIKNIDKNKEKLTENTNEILDKGIKTQYKTSREEENKAINKELKVTTKFDLIPEKQVEKAIKNPLDKVGFLQRNENNNEANKNMLNRIITNGIIQGKGYAQIAEDIDKRFDIGFNNALRIARTEGHRVANQGTLDAMKEAQSKGVKAKKKWLTARDEKVRAEHQQLNGQIVNIDEYFELYSTGDKALYPGGFGVPSLDINCRCVAITILEMFESDFAKQQQQGFQSM